MCDIARLRATYLASWGPALLVLLILSCDAVLGRLHNVLLLGVVDESAHLATVGLVLVAFRRAEWLDQRRREAALVMAAAVLIDLDHLPLYAGLPHVALGGRPFSHSLLSVGVLLLVAAVMPANRRRWPLAMAVGVGLHLVRDVATGPGVLLVWPISDREFVAPYSAYLLLCLALAVIATLRVIGAWRTDAETGDRRGGCH